MSRGRGTAAAAALVLSALLAAGCGFGPGADVGAVSLTVTRDYGRERVLGPVSDQASESDTVMRVLDRNAALSTGYGGGFVRSIDGVSEDVRDGRRYDWFFYVNGIESPVGAAEVSLHGGEAIWWDYRDWSGAAHVPAVVGSWPQPFAGGYEGHPAAAALECEGDAAACGVVRRRLRSTGVELGGGADAVRVLVGPWARLREDPVASLLEGGPQESGVFADFAPSGAGWQLRGLDEEGRPARRFRPSTGLVAATRRYEGPPVWLVTGGSAAGVSLAAALLDRRQLADRYAVAVEGSEEVPLPLS